MRNLKVETLDVLKGYGKTWADVRWVGRSDGTIRIHPDIFLELADREYDSGYGSVEVNMGLVVVGDDWWLERYEYDGSEGWCLKSMPILQTDYKLGKEVFIKEYNDNWDIMTNLEYLEWEAHDRKKATT